MEANENQQSVVRCVGKPNEEVKVYLEEKSDLFLKENMTDRVGHFQMYYLLGREYRLGRQTVYLIRGILEGESGSERQIQFSQEQLHSLQRRQQRQFPKFKVLGWALNQPGYGSDGAWRFAKQNENFFTQAPILLMGDGLEGTLAFYQWEDGDYHELGGYYVYSDQNPADFRSAQTVQQHAPVQRLQEKGEEEGPMPWELPKENKKRSVWEHLDRLPVREKRNEEETRDLRGLKIKKQEVSPLRVLTSISAIMLTVILVMGMLLFNSVSTLDGIQSRLEMMDLQIEEIHYSMTGTGGSDTIPTQAPASGSEVSEDTGGDIAQ